MTAPVPIAGLYIAAKRSRTCLRCSPWMVGRKPYFSSGPPTHATGTPGTANDRGRLGPKLTVVTTFSLFGSNSRATRPSHPSVPTLTGSQVCQMSMARKWDRGDSFQPTPCRMASFLSSQNCFNGAM